MMGVSNLLETWAILVIIIILSEKIDLHTFDALDGIIGPRDYFLLKYCFKGFAVLFSVIVKLCYFFLC